MKDTGKQLISGNDQKYTVGHCRECEAGEHGDYGSGTYYLIHHSEYRTRILVCDDHLDIACEDGLIVGDVYAERVKSIPSHTDDEI